MEVSHTRPLIIIVVRDDLLLLFHYRWGAYRLTPPEKKTTGIKAEENYASTRPLNNILGLKISLNY